MTSVSRLRRLVVSMAFGGLIAAGGLAPASALAYGTCDTPQIKVESNWLVPLWEGDCARFNGSFGSRSETLRDGSRAERFEIALMGASCVQATINSTDFEPDVYVYDDEEFRHEVGQWQRSTTQARSTVKLSRSAADSMNVYYVMATSFGPGAQYGKYTLDLRTC